MISKCCNFAQKRVLDETRLGGEGDPVVIVQEFEFDHKN